MSVEEALRLRDFVRRAELMDGRIAGARVARPEDAAALAEFLSHESIGPRIYTMPDPISAVTMGVFIEDHLMQRARGEGILFVSFNAAGQATAYFDVELWPHWSICKFGGAVRAERFLRNGKPLGFLEAAVGGQSVGVPGVLRMLELAHQRHGRLPWSGLFEAAIRVAEAGFAPSPKLRAALEKAPELSRYYSADRVVNREYADTLRVIARGGAQAFYEGDLARDIVLTVRTHAKPGDLTEDDLRRYRAVERDPVCGPYREWRVCSMGPPSSGAVAVLQILGLLERTAFARAPPQSAAALHWFAEAGKLAYADRARYLGDADFSAVPVGKLLSGTYLDRRASLIGDQAMLLAPPGDPEAGTSHFSIVDANGDIVSMTTTIEAAFGSRVMARGFLLNNQLTDFDFIPGGPNAVAAGKRPRSSMAPTVVFEKDRPHLVIGSPGGAMIINYVAKVLVGVLDWRLPVAEAIALPNFGSRNGPTYLEQGTRYEGLVGALQERGHDVQMIPLPSGLHGIERLPGGWRGGADPRREGAVRGE